MVDPAVLRTVAAGVLASVVDARRAIHRHPELAHLEYRTTELLAGVLRDAGLAPRLRTPKTGLTLDLGEAGRRVVFRCDLDALPIHESTGLPFASEVPGVMHACGHDAHAAIGLGVALGLGRLGELPGRVRVVFQPAEETFPGGAYEMLKEGVLHDVDAAVAFHVDPSLEVGSVGLLAGPITSSADRFYITLEGPGGHTARPHQTVDLIHAAGRVVTELLPLIHLQVDARSPLSLVFGRIQGGTADNVIPVSVEMSGTARTLDRDLWERLPGMLEQLVHDIVLPTGAKAVFHYQRGIPPVVNDAGVIDVLHLAMGRVLGHQAVAGTHTSMGAEDFARFLDVTPGALVRLGARPGLRSVDLHSSTFDIDEGALEVGVLAGMAAVLGLLSPP
jgi:amidohydrolase